MAAHLAKSSFVNNVIFVNPVRSWRNRRTSAKGINSIVNLYGTNLFPLKHHDNIRVYSPYRFIPYKNAFPSLIKIENQLIHRMIRLMNKSHPYILLMNDPIRIEPLILDHILEDAQLSIFDLSDDFVEYFSDINDPRRLICVKNIEKYAGSADIVLTVNQHLKAKYQYVNKCVHVIRNATNYDNFDRSVYAPVEYLDVIKASNRPIIGYIGGVRANRLDFNLLEYIFNNKKRWQFVFIGDADQAFINRYHKYDNVHLFPPVNYSRLPDCLNYFDISFIPFKQNEHTKGNDLLKLYDFLAMGKSVVSTKIDGVLDFKSIIHLADTPSKFIEKMELAIAENSSHHIHKRKSVALMNSWSVRIKELESVLKIKLENITANSNEGK